MGKAQELTPELQFTNPKQIIGTFNTGKDVIVASFLETRTTDNLDLYLLSFLNEAQTKVEITVISGSRFIGARTSNEGTYFVFMGPTPNVLQIGRLTDEGNVSLTQLVSNDWENFSGNVRMLETNAAGNLCITQNYSYYYADENNQRAAAYGTEVMVFDAALQLLGRNQVTGTGKFIDTYPTSQGFIGVYEQYDYEKKLFQLDLMIFDQEATLIGAHPLVTEKVLFPSEIIEHNNQILIVGYYFGESIFDANQTAGIFTRKLDLTGKQLANHTFPWEDLKTKLKNDNRGGFIFNGEKSVVIEHIIPNAEGFQVIGESYSRNSGVSMTKILTGISGDKRKVVTVYDFVRFQLSTEGEVVSAEIIEKKPMNIEVSGNYYAQSDGLSLELSMKKNGVFPFQFIEGEVVTFIQYKNDTGTVYQLNLKDQKLTEKQRLVLDPVVMPEWTLADQRVADSKMLTRLSNLQTKSDNFDQRTQNLVNRLEYGSDKIDYIYEPYRKSGSGHFLLDNGDVLLFQIDPERYSVFYEKLTR
jgi:hypothetical protein